MKKLFLILVLSLSMATVSAQSYREAGTKSMVEISGGVDGSSPCGGITFAYGYQFESHFTVGGGLGYLNVEGTSLLPVFSFARWDFIDSRTTPFVEVRLGLAHDTNDTVTRLYCSPSVGVAIGRFSIGAGVASFGFDKKNNSMVGYIAKIGWTF